MKAASSGLAAHLAAETATLATCWRVERRDGAVFRFTDSDLDLVVSGETYRAATGYARTALASEAGLAAGGLEVEGLLDADEIAEDALRAGLFDFAEVRIFAVNRADLSQGELKLRRGRFGEVTLGEDGLFRTELRGLAQALSQTVGALYGPECRADLGDARCGVAISGPTFQRPGEVATVVSRSEFTVTIDTPSAEAGYYSGGVLIWTSGANAGVATEVKKWVVGTATVTLFLPAAFAVEVGDEFDIRPGCDKRFVTCRTKFDNAVNFRGEPFIPGVDSVLKVASKRVAKEKPPVEGESEFDADPGP